MNPSTGPVSGVPPLAAGECQVWWATSDDPAPALLDLLDGDERARCERLHFDADRRRYLAAHALARIVVGVLLGIPPARLRRLVSCRRCGSDTHGKPALGGAGPPAIELSLSHSGAWVVVAVTRGVPVGVDVEQVRLRGQEIPTVALSTAERSVLDKLPDADQVPGFIRYWTRKEALLKATGDGLSVPFGHVTVSAPDQPPALLAWDYSPAPPSPAHLVDLSPRDGHLASLATLGDRVRVFELDGDPLLRAPTARQRRSA